MMMKTGLMTDFGANGYDYINSRERQANFNQLVDTELLCYLGTQGARKQLREKR